MMNGDHSRDVLLLFAKAPRAGHVKSRLAKDVGVRWAARLQAAFLVDECQRFSQLEARRILCVAPDLKHPTVQGARELGYDLWEQGPGNLGDRLERAVARAFAEGAHRVVVVGSDSPTLPLVRVVQAFVALGACRAVLGPSFDGGYYLIGMSEALPGVMAGVTWSSSRVFAQTSRNIAQLGIAYTVLPFWYDVDDLSGLRLVADHLGLQSQDGRFEATQTATVLAELSAQKPGLLPPL